MGDGRGTAELQHKRLEHVKMQVFAQVGRLPASSEPVLRDLCARCLQKTNRGSAPSASPRGLARVERGLSKAPGEKTVPSGATTWHAQ